MTSPDFAYIEQRMRAATAELREAMESALQEMLRFQRENRPTEEERRALQEAALRGDLGDDMRTLARLVEAGEEDWDRIYSGESPNAGLLRGHLDRMVAEHRDDIVRAIEEDEEFDPMDPESRPSR
ncbi:hypothetical protein [Plantactinospora sp. ZYX-F-223]|uniref:hypothetical protein n=1 Tax=Plantactinospora sp. ZYX-F-223 TaxID=3144103 RepID=UPI0031FD2A17